MSETTASHSSMLNSVTVSIIQSASSIAANVLTLMAAIDGESLSLLFYGNVISPMMKLLRSVSACCCTYYKWQYKSKAKAVVKAANELKRLLEEARSIMGDSMFSSAQSGYGISISSVIEQLDGLIAIMQDVCGGAGKNNNPQSD
jgi:hypothetical protein